MSEHTFEFNNEIDLTKLESEETRAMTAEEQHYIETKQALWSIEKQLIQINTILCELGTKISNIVYKLNDMDNSIILRDS